MQAKELVGKKKKRPLLTQAIGNDQDTGRNKIFFFSRHACICGLFWSESVYTYVYAYLYRKLLFTVEIFSTLNIYYYNKYLVPSISICIGNYCLR